MSLPSNERQPSPSSTSTPKTHILEPPPTPHDQKQSPEIIIDWDGPQDPDNPKKSVRHLFLAQSRLLLSLYSWSFRRKWAATFVVSSFTFISPVSSSMVAPATAQIASDFGVKSNIIIAMMTSIFVAGYGQFFILAPGEGLASETQNLYFEPCDRPLYI